MLQPDEIQKIQEDFFLSDATLDVDFRLIKLKQLKQTIKFYENDILLALKKDLGKGNFEAFSSEIGLIQLELTHHIRKLKKWTIPRKAKTPVYLFPSKSRVQYQPYGKVLVISPFNYPFMLTLAPLIGAVSAGNVVVLKPSEYASASVDIIEKIITDVFQKEYVQVIKGGVEESTQLLEMRWDKIFFTGSSHVGKIVLEAAAKNLTPVVLEMGGKNPVVVDADANLKIAAKRIIWGKLLNAGQSCVAPDYVFVHVSKEKEFLKYAGDAIKQFYSENPGGNGDFTRIINKNAVQRLSEYLEQSTIYHGGIFETDSNYFSPTVLADVSEDSPIMQEEIFGPVLPVLTFESLDRVLNFIRKKEKPLAAFYFSESRKKQQEFLNKTFSGDAMINDVVVHFTNFALPFGGVGFSGMGSYHGKRSFEVFSHERSVMRTSTWFDLPLRYPPYKRWIYKIIRVLLK